MRNTTTRVVSLRPTDADERLVGSARRVFQGQISALEGLFERVDGAFASAVHTLYNTPGHVALIGVGKSGVIAKKLAATFASTGTPAFFINAAEAHHGDLGMRGTGCPVVFDATHSVQQPGGQGAASGGQRDMLVKGQLDRDLPAVRRPLSDRQIAWVDSLRESGVLVRRFNTALFTNGDSREPELAGIRGAIVGSFYMRLVSPW